MHKQVATISPDVLAQEVSGETVLLDLKSESYFGLDELGTRIWQLLQENGSVQILLDTLLQEYNVEAEQLESDIENLLKELDSEGLIKLSTVD